MTLKTDVNIEHGQPVTAGLPSNFDFMIIQRPALFQIPLGVSLRPMSKILINFIKSCVLLSMALRFSGQPVLFWFTKKKHRAADQASHRMHPHDPRHLTLLYKSSTGSPLDRVRISPHSSNSVICRGWALDFLRASTAHTRFGLRIQRHMRFREHNWHGLTTVGVSQPTDWHNILQIGICGFEYYSSVFPFLYPTLFSNFLERSNFHFVELLFGVRNRLVDGGICGSSIFWRWYYF